MKMTLIVVSSMALLANSTASIAQASAQAAAQVSEAAPDPKADAKAAKAAAKAEAKRQKERLRLYGLGPYPEEIDAYLADKKEELKPLYKALLTGGERNAVLNFNRIGLAAMQHGDWKEAEWAFDRSLAQIERIYADNEQASAARSVFHNESNKDFKGEPYERSMAYYYRGLLYLRAGDFDNARASFKGGEFQDTLSETENFQSDFAALNYLIGWTQKCQGQNTAAQEAFDIAAKSQPGLVPPADDHNLLLIAELGNGPLKARAGGNEEMLTFVAGGGYPDTSARFSVNSPGTAPLIVDTQPVSSVYYQATTRGGRAIDGIMKGKAAWKAGTDGVGSALMTMGLGNDSSAAMGLGLALSLFSSAMKTKADIRAWDGLPDLIQFGTAKAEKPNWTADVAFRTGEVDMDIKPAALVSAPGQKCSLSWARARAVPVPSDSVFGEDPGVAQSVSRKKPVMEKDKLFRETLK